MEGSGGFIRRVHRRERSHIRSDVLQFAVLHDDDGAGQRHHDVHLRDADDGPGPVQRSTISVRIASNSEKKRATTS